MKLSLEWFCIVIFSIALKKSSAEIPDCDFQDTVDISNAAIQNDTYIYDGLKIPADLVGEYRTRQLIDGSTVPVQSHLRACICQLPRPCVRFCCFQDNLLDQDECSDGLREVIARKKPYLELYYMNLDNKTVTSRKHYLHSEITVLRTQSLGCKEITLKQKDFFMLLAVRLSILRIYIYLCLILALFRMESYSSALFIEGSQNPITASLLSSHIPLFQCF